MAKWNSALPGCSGHLHQSLWEGEQNVFHDEKVEDNMSPIFRSYLAGQMQLLPEILPFFAPNVNSYKRLVEGFLGSHPGDLGGGQSNRRLPRDSGQPKINATRDTGARFRYQPLPRGGGRFGGGTLRD